MAELEKRLNVWRGTGMMVSIVLGAGLLTLPGLAVQAAGEAALTIWLLCALASVPLLAVFALLARLWPDAGGIAVILSKGFGDYGYSAGTFLFLGAVALGLPAIALTGGHYLTAAIGGDPHAFAIMLIGGAVAVNVRSSRFATWVNSALAIVVVVAILVLLAVSWAVTTPDVHDVPAKLAHVPDLSVLAPTFMMLFFAFTGWEVAASLGGEFQSPERDIPLAITFSFLLVTGTYMGLALVADASGIVGNAEAIFSDILGAAFGVEARWVVSAVAVCLIFANLCAAIWAVSRMVFAAAGEHLLPIGFRETHHGIPRRALVVTGTVLTAVTVASWVDAVSLPGLLAMAGQNFLVLYGAAAAVMLRVATHPMARITAAVSLAIVCVLSAIHGPSAIAYPAMLMVAASLATWHRRGAHNAQAPVKFEV